MERLFLIFFIFYFSLVEEVYLIGKDGNYC